MTGPYLKVAAPRPWASKAACLGLDPNIFHPERGSPSTGRHAKAICAECPVTAECLEDALADVGQLGIAGGTSMKERRLILRQRGAPPRFGPRPQPIAHGTERGASTHRRRGEAPCDLCRDASTTAANNRRNRVAS